MPLISKKFKRPDGVLEEMFVTTRVRSDGTRETLGLVGPVGEFSRYWLVGDTAEDVELKWAAVRAMEELMEDLP